MPHLHLDWRIEINHYLLYCVLFIVFIGLNELIPMPDSEQSAHIREINGTLISFLAFYPWVLITFEDAEYVDSREDDTLLEEGQPETFLS